MPRCSAAGLDFRIIPAGFNAPLKFLTGFISGLSLLTMRYCGRAVALSDGLAQCRFVVKAAKYPASNRLLGYPLDS